MKCDGAEFAEIIVRPPNGVIKIRSKNPGVEVGCSPPGGMRIIVGGTGVNNDFSGGYAEIPFADGGGTENDSYTLSTRNCSLAIGCGADSPGKNGSFVQARLFKNGSLINTFAPIGWYGVSILRIEKIKAKFVVNDKSGKIFEEEFDKCPDYTISCGDECPEGYMKCLCSRPPGYCCIPCNQLNSELTGIKGALNR